MKKILVAVFSFVLFLAGCSNSDKEITRIDPQDWFSRNWVSIDDSFNKQLDETQYIKNLEDFLSYNILSITKNKPFTSDLKISAKFDESSSVQWGVKYSWNKIVKSNDLEYSDVEFKIEAEDIISKTPPFDLSWSVGLLYKNNEVYANLHNLNVFMWEWNMVAKMYTLLWDLIIGSRVDLEIHSWWIISLDEKLDTKLPYFIWTLKNILKTEDIQSDSNFLWSTVEMLDLINSYIDLWISTNEISLISQDLSYFELVDWSIQKLFTWSFQWKESSFDLFFSVSKEWLEVCLYNIKEYNEDTLDFEDIDKQFRFILDEDEKFEYLIEFESSNLQQRVIHFQWKVKYADVVSFSANFILEPLEIVAGQKISWKLDWNIIKKSWEWNEKIPEITGNVILWSELLASL